MLHFLTFAPVHTLYMYTVRTLSLSSRPKDLVDSAKGGPRDKEQIWLKEWILLRSLTLILVPWVGLNQTENQSETCGLLKLEAVEAKIEKKPRYWFWRLGCRCSFNFRGREATTSMASEVKTEAWFGLSGPDYLLGPVFEVAIGLVNTGPKKLMYPFKNRGKRRTNAP